jgi:hypothetical protein
LPEGHGVLVAGIAGAFRKNELTPVFLRVAVSSWLCCLVMAKIEDLFTQASKDCPKAFELKQELDRLGVFKEYEDRFLDMFKK